MVNDPQIIIFLKRDNMKKQPLNIKPSNSNGDYIRKAHTLDISKFANTRSDIERNFDNSKIKPLEDSSEKENVSDKPSYTKDSTADEKQKEPHEVKNLYESQTYTTNSKLNQLKSLSSSLKPNLFKSIGVQVGSGKG